MEIRKRDGESSTSLIYRFTKRVQQSGILREAKKRRFRARPESRIKRKLSALHRVEKKEKFEHAKKMGTTV
jgi:ribosomal protein S21